MGWRIWLAAAGYFLYSFAQTEQPQTNEQDDALELVKQYFERSDWR